MHCRFSPFLRIGATQMISRRLDGHSSPKINAHYPHMGGFQPGLLPTDKSRFVNGREQTAVMNGDKTGRILVAVIHQDLIPAISGA
jgi:hypothetical protein